MKLGLISLGCSKNLVDSENILGFLINKKGFQLVEDLSTADIVVVNTCAFIGDAKEESIEAILEVAEHKTHGSLKKIMEDIRKLSLSVPIRCRQWLTIQIVLHALSLVTVLLPLWWNRLRKITESWIRY